MAWTNWKKLNLSSVAMPAIMQRLVPDSGGQTFTSRFDAFRAALGGDVAQTWIKGGVWQPDRSIGGSVSSSPSMVRPSTGRMNVFVRWADRSVKHRWVLDNGQLDVDWQPLGGTITSAPAAAFAKPGIIFLFGRGTDNALWYLVSKKGRELFEDWKDSRWQKLGGQLMAAPAAAATAGLVVVAVLGTKNDVYCRWAKKAEQHYYFPQTANGGWLYLGKPRDLDFIGQSADENFVATHLAVGLSLKEAFVCALGADGGIYAKTGAHSNFPAGWNDDPLRWEKLPAITDPAHPGTTVAAQAITASGSSLYALGTNHQLYLNDWI